MKRIQESLAGKVVAVLLMLGLTFTGSFFGMKALMATYYMDTDDYTQTSEFYDLAVKYHDKIAFLAAEKQSLEENAAGLSYVARRQMMETITALEEELAPENTNFRFCVRLPDGTEVGSTLKEGETLGWSGYACFEEGEHAASEVGGAMYTSDGRTYMTDAPTEKIEGATVYTIESYVLSEEQMVKNEVEDEFYSLSLHYHQAKVNLSDWAMVALACLAGAVLCMIYILWAAGHKAGAEDIVLSWQEKIFFDLYLAVMAVPIVAAFVCGLVVFRDAYVWDRWNHTGTLYLTTASVLFTLLVGIVTLTLRTLAVRLKAHALGRTTLLCRVVGWTVRTVHDFLCNLPITWKVAVGYVVFFLVSVMLVIKSAYNGEFWAIVWFLLNAVVLMFLCWWTVCLRKIQKGSEIIAAGNLSHQIDTAKMPHDLKSHAEALNNITGGLQNAVNEQMKSERFKAELITNVSHDLKTPLTSIINYVDLLKTTDQQDPKAQEYIEVLDRKAQRLKKLTEDLVEASKASTGTLSVQREKIGMGQLVSQALGEYQEKLESRNLTLVTDLPEEETFVYADGRHLWRVIDNLLGNCCKYAMEGTRVYLELTRGQGQVVLAVKNISREPLNMPPEQLMERFVRGEESRTTEGSGLGLSIARSLTELQGGTFQLAVDGDLFKAIVTMPQAG